MRLLHPDGSVVHLAYCTNVHPAEDLPGIRAQLTGFAARVRDLLGVQRLGVGLWLPYDAAHALLADLPSWYGCAACSPSSGWRWSRLTASRIAASTKKS